MHDFTERYAAQRRRAWPEIEAFFRELPVPLADMGWQFAQRLGRQTSLSGDFRGALEHPAAARVAYLPLWHCAAYRKQGVFIPRAELLQTHLFAAAFLGFCAIRIQDDLVDGDSPDTSVDELLLASLFTVRAVGHLQRLFPSDAPLWQHHARHWHEYAQAVQIDKQRDASGLSPFDETDLLHIGRKAALLKTFPVAVALCAGREDQIGSIEALMDAFNTAIQLSNDIQSVRSDLEMGHYTQPLAAAALDAGFAPGTQPPQTGLLGSLLLSGAMGEAYELTKGYFERARVLSAEFGIDDLVAFIDWHMADMEKSAAHWRDLRIDGERLPVAFFRLKDETRVAETPLPDLDRCLDLANRFLGFDPECRESWELQRTGAWGQELLIGDVFSRALVTETLAEQGLAAPGQVEAVLEQYRENGWRYYRDFKALPPDIDDIAQAIRLLSHSAWDAETRRCYLAPPLRWLAANRATDGAFPVWLTEGIEDRPAAGWVPLGGEGCLACEANLLDALAGCGAEEAADWVGEGVRRLADRWMTQGPSGVYYYKPAVGAAMIAGCLVRHRRWLKGETAAQLDDRLRRMAGEQNAVPPTGDVLALAAGARLAAIAEDPEREAIARYLSALASRQSFDGGWEAGGLFRCPGATRQDIGWHGGRLLTTQYVARTLTAIQSRLSGELV